MLETSCWQKMVARSFKNVIYKCVDKSYLIYMYKDDLALNNRQRLICHKTKPDLNLDQLTIKLYVNDLY